MIRFRSYRAKLQAAFLALGLAAIGATGWTASIGASEALRQATYNRLTAIHETRCRQFERYFRDVSNHVLALSSDESTIAALEQLREAWEALPPSLPGSAPYAALKRYYAETHAGHAPEWFPSDGRAVTLQYHYLALNPHPLGAKDLLLAAPGAGAYGRIHARYHPTLHRYQSAFGFYDILLAGARDGRILYTVMKEIDLGMALEEPPYRGTTLARAYRRAMALGEPEEVVIEDYAPYAASHFAPAAFVAAPVWRAGAKIGALAIQVPVSEVNRVMTGERNWREEGLGETGQAYIVGRDGTLRSDMRFEIERPEEYFRQLEQAGAGPDVIARIRRHGTGVLTLRASPEVAARHASGGRGTEMGRDARGVSVLRSYAAIDVPGLNWMLVAEIEAREALAPVRALRLRILWVGLVVAAVFLFAARWLAGSVTRPVLALARSARRLGGGDFGIRMPVESEDEIGQLAASFNRMAEELERTTVSKEDLDRTLGALTNAVIVVSVWRGATVDEILASPVRQANPAAHRLLGYRERELEGLPFRVLLPGRGAGWRPLLERLPGGGSLPAVEAELLPRNGGPVPVLAAAAWLREQSGQEAGIVCAAQDITERKLAEAALRQKQAELEDLAGRLITAQEEERSRLARELHDDLTQRLAAVAIEAGRLERTPADDPAAWRAGLDRIKRQMARISDDIHGLSRRLHPSTLDDLGLVAAVESECRGFFERGGPPVEFSFQGSFDSLPLDAQLGLYRIVQEGLRNVYRHAGAETVSIRLWRTARTAELEIRDDGRGFDRSDPAWRPGLGLASMEERARLLGGRFSVESRPGHGASINVSLPAPEVEEERDETEDTAGRRS